MLTGWSAPWQSRSRIRTLRPVWAAAEKTVLAKVILSTTCEQLNVNTRPPGATLAMAAALSRW